MFIGHFAVGFAAKKSAPETSLGTMLMAALWCDLVFGVLMLAGMERAAIESDGRFMPINLIDLPWSHSLLMTLAWALLLGGGYYLLRRRRRGAVWVGLAVLSHWVLDFISHRPDMTLYPGATRRFGLGLWDSPAATLVAEGGAFAAAVWLYCRSSPAQDAVGRWSLLTLVAFLSVLYAATFFSPPPPDIRLVAAGNLLALLFPPWAAWTDRHRQSSTTPNMG